MTDHEHPFDTGRQRPLVTVLDMLRARIDHDAFDAAIFSLESVAADLGYGDIRPLPGAIAWIDELRGEGKKIALVFSGESAQSALELAGIADRFDLVTSGPRVSGTIVRILDELDVAADRTILVDVAPRGIAAAGEAGLRMAIAVARGSASPEQLRQSGADTVVADLQELLGPT
jgi:beta-phosphoglucomutase-like phosphatase (HAD superfamily)